LSGDESYLGQARDFNPIYFDNDILSLSSHEIVVDGGGYTGDTFLKFITTAKTFEQYYLCEPDLKNMRIAQKNLFEYSGIIYVPAGLWSKKDKLTFSATGTAGSRLGDYGNICVDVVSIDEILNSEPATFIKLYIEGAEMEALKGAVKTIQKYKPVLAICVYHKVGDFIDIPNLIKQLNPDYRFYLRHYSSGRTDTVCYAL